MTRHVHKHWFRFAQIPEELIYSEVSGRAIKIFSALLRHGDDPTNCYPSHKRLADKCHMSMATVRRAIAELEESGWVSVEARYRDAGQTSNGYTLFDTPLLTGEHPPLLKNDTPPCSPVSNEGEQWNDSQLNENSSSVSNLSNNALEPPEKPDDDDDGLIRHATQQATQITNFLGIRYGPSPGLIAISAEAITNGWTPDDFTRLAVVALDLAESPYPYYVKSLRAASGDFPPADHQLDLTL